MKTNRCNRYYILDTLTVERAVQDYSTRLTGRLLEIGCGLSPYRDLFRATATRYVASDIDPSASLPEVVCDGARLAFQSGSFDSVLCTQVLEHVPEPVRVLGEIARVLRPGGTVLLTVPLNSGVHGPPHDYFRFTEFGLRRLCEQAGLAVEELVERGGRITNAAQALLLVFEIDRMRRRNVVAALLRRAIRIFCWAVERWALPLDRRFPKEGNPVGYALLARKAC
jgi:SAM-dependent methyltransferase